MSCGHFMREIPHGGRYRLSPKEADHRRACQTGAIFTSLSLRRKASCECYGDFATARSVCEVDKAPVDSRKAPIRIQLLVFGFAARTTRVGVMNRKFGNQRVTWFHPRLR